ncbi:MAG: hypothetical protein WC447_02590 [Candidatus Paceibacterota bacterium]|jgi:hypothetical protein
MDEEEKDENLMMDGMGNEDEPLDLPDEPLEEIADDEGEYDPDSRYH